MNWIHPGEIAIIHKRVLDETGGASGILSSDQLESALARPFAAFGNVELYPDFISKVAALIHALITSHPFIDGNKRVALVAGDVCLRLNGYRLIPSEEVEPFFWSIARGEQSVESIRNWLIRHTEPLE